MEFSWRCKVRFRALRSNANKRIRRTTAPPLGQLTSEHLTALAEQSSSSESEEESSSSCSSSGKTPEGLFGAVEVPGSRKQAGVAHDIKKYCTSICQGDLEVFGCNKLCAWEKG